MSNIDKLGSSGNRDMSGSSISFSSDLFKRLDFQPPEKRDATAAEIVEKRLILEDVVTDDDTATEYKQNAPPLAVVFHIKRGKDFVQTQMTDLNIRELPVNRRSRVRVRPRDLTYINALSQVMNTEMQGMTGLGGDFGLEDVKARYSNALKVSVKRMYDVSRFAKADVLKIGRRPDSDFVSICPYTSRDHGLAVLHDSLMRYVDLGTLHTTYSDAEDDRRVASDPAAAPGDGRDEGTTNGSYVFWKGDIDFLKNGAKQWKESEILILPSFQDFFVFTYLTPAQVDQSGD